MSLKSITKAVLICCQCFFVITLLFILCGCSTGLSDGPYQATGIKIGEVTDNAAIVWTRLTRNPERVRRKASCGGTQGTPLGTPYGAMPQILYRNPKTGELTERRGGRPNLTPVVNFPEGSTIHTIEGAVPGAPGTVRVLYKIKGASDWKSTNWKAVDPQRDYTGQFKLTDLKPNAEYQVRVEAGAGAIPKGTPFGGGKKGQVVAGRFRTAPRTYQPERVVFMVSTGQAYPDQDVAGGGFKIYPAMLKLDPSFFVHTGDILYYDKLAKTIELAR